MHIAIDADANGLDLKKKICDHLAAEGIPFQDLAYLDHHQVDYPDIAFNLANRVRAGEFDRGILICGTGQGMAMCANKVKGIYAGACSDTYSAERLRKSNNAQILCLGALVIGEQTAISLVEAWLKSDFQGGRSAPKVERMHALEEMGSAAAAD